MDISRHCLRPNLSDRPPQKKAPNIIPRYTMLPGDSGRERETDLSHLESNVCWLKCWVNKTHHALWKGETVCTRAHSRMYSPDTHSVVEGPTTALSAPNRTNSAFKAHLGSTNTDFYTSDKVTLSFIWSHMFGLGTSVMKAIHSPFSFVFGLHHLLREISGCLAAKRSTFFTG